MRPDARRAHERALSLSERLSILTEGNEQLATALSAIVRRSRTPSSLRALASVDSDGWRRLVGESGAAPTNTPGQTADERAATYAKRLARVVGMAFPTAALVTRMKADPPRSVANAVRYLVEHPDFEIGKTPLSFVAASPPGAGTSNEVKAELKSIQRVVEISPTPDVVPVLLKAGITSAQMVADLGRDGLLERYPGEVCLRVSEMAFERAQATLIADESAASWAVPRKAVSRRHSAPSAPPPMQPLR